MSFCSMNGKSTVINDCLEKHVWAPAPDTVPEVVEVPAELLGEIVPSPPVGSFL